MPSASERWLEEGRAWVRAKQARGKWLGRNGSDAVRLFRRCGTWISHTPLGTTEADLWEIAKRVGLASKTKLTYLRLVGNFLASRGNRIVQECGILRAFPNRAVNTPVVSPEDRDRILSAAQGPERVVVALLSGARRRVEIVRARVSDFRLEREEYDIRAKGGRGEVTHRSLPISESLRRELGWWLPLRAKWASDAASDSGHLVCRWDGPDLVGVSYQYVDRLLHSAEDRAAVRRWPAHSFRRGAATLAIERGAGYDDVSELLCDSSPEVSKGYIAPFVRRRRHAETLRLIEPAPPPRGKL